MAGSAGSIYVDLLLRDAQYVSGWNKARQTTKNSTSQIQGDLGRTQQAFSNVISPVNNLGSAIQSLGGVVAGALSIQQLVRYTDTWRQLEGRLSLVVSNMSDLSGTQSALFDIAQRTRQPLEGVYNLYTRLSQAIPEASRSQFDLLGVTESINQALAITGEGSAQAASAILQFTQAAASGFKGSGQEINALLDSAPRLAIALQRSFGDGKKSLKQLSQAGELDLETILRSLSGVGEEGRKLREEFEKIPPTVGQAFTQLDNAFLSFLGQSELAQSGASSLVIVIQSLANNLDLAAKAIIALSVVFTARLIPDIAKSINLFISGQGSAIAYTAAINSTSAALGANSAASQRWATALAAQQVAAAGAVSNTVIAVNRAGQAATVTASAFSLLSTAVSTASRAFLALIGGLPGAAFIALSAAVYSYTDSLDQAEKVSQKYKGVSSELYRINLEIVNASKERKVSLIAERDELLKKAQAELKDTEALLKKYEVLKELGGFFGLGAALGARRGENATRERLDQLYKEIDALSKEQMDVINNGVGSANRGEPLPSFDDGSAAKKRQKELQDSYEKYEYLIKGVKKEIIEYQREEAALAKLYEANKITLDQYYTALSGLDEKYDEAADKANKFGVDSEQFAKRAAENIQDAFADFLFDPFEQGLDGMLKGFIDTVRKMIAEAQAARLAKELFGEMAGGEGEGILGGVLGSIFNGFGGAETVDSGGWFDGWFAEGGFIAPGHFGVAGEEGAELVYGGRTGATVIPTDGNKGNTYVIDARGTDSSVVMRLEQSLMALAGPGVIERRVSGAQARGEL